VEKNEEFFIHPSENPHSGASTIQVMEQYAKEPVYWVVGALFLWLAYYLHGPWAGHWADGFSSYWGQ